MTENLKENSGQLVVKDNDLIRKSRYSLTANQQKLIAYITSRIKPTDKEFKREYISVADFCKLCNIDKKHFYTEFKDMIDNLDSKSFWIENEDVLTKFHWFHEVKVNKGSGIIELVLNTYLQEYLLGLRENFTKYELYNVLLMKSKYSLRLYELFKSYEWQKNIYIELEKLKEYLNTESYKKTNDFKKRCLKPAVEEINRLTDINISYTEKKRGRAIVGFNFSIQLKEAVDRGLLFRDYIDTAANK